MAQMTLHWSPLSPFVRKVMCAAHELDLVSSIRCVRTKVASQQPNLDLVPDNPLIKIPTLVLADGRALFDSVVICEYLDSLAADTHLYPDSGDARWQALRWQALGDGLCDTLIAWRHERDRAAEHRAQALLAALQLKVQACLDQLTLEVPQLERSRFGIGHVAIGCALGYLGVRFADLPWQASHPDLAAWYGVFEQRPAALATRPAMVA